MLHSRADRDREGGQILVLFELVLIVILVVTAMVIDLGVLRNNRQILVNTFDAAALAGGYKLPVDGSIAPVGSQATAANTLINSTIQADYPGLPTSTTAIGTRCVAGVDSLISKCAYTITYKCLVGVDPTGQPYLSRDVPLVCNPTHAVGHTPAVAGDFQGAGATRFSACNPTAGDLCNVVVISGSATTQYAIAPVVGIPSGSTRTVVSVACNGPCGASPVVPVDVVLIMDRTLSMTAPEIADIQSGASTVLSVLNPAVQRVALGTIGPSTPGLSACPGQSTSPVANLVAPANQVYAVGSSTINFYAYPNDLPKWMPVDFTGTDTGTPAVTWNEAYSTNGVTNTNSRIWKAISCLYSYTSGTNLDTPVYMAQQYLNTYGRAGVKKGIILETDGAPQAGDGSAHYTCAQASATAATAKAATNNIDIFTIYYAHTANVKCPQKTGQTVPNCTGSTGTNNNETAAWSCQPASSLLQNMASPNTTTEPQHFFNAPDSATIGAAFYQAAVSLAQGSAHLVQLYPTPIVTSVSGTPATHNGGTAVTITGKYFTGATSVTFGMNSATIVSVSDTSIVVKAPAGAISTCDIIVTTPGGSSFIVPADHFTYN